MAETYGCGRPELYTKHGCIAFFFLVLVLPSAGRDSKPSPVKIMTDQNQLDNVKYCNYLGKMITK
jgi:hypothetical protein